VSWWLVFVKNKSIFSNVFSNRTQITAQIDPILQWMSIVQPYIQMFWSTFIFLHWLWMFIRSCRNRRHSNPSSATSATTDTTLSYLRRLKQRQRQQHLIKSDVVFVQSEKESFYFERPYEEFKFLSVRNSKLTWSRHPITQWHLDANLRLFTRNLLDETSSITSSTDANIDNDAEIHVDDRLYLTDSSNDDKMLTHSASENLLSVDLCTNGSIRYRSRLSENASYLAYKKSTREFYFVSKREDPDTVCVKFSGSIS
jgi:hypothetical protein